ncbi:hypothetical protein B0H19DRAFT_1190765 [Mycena capillaripes]|nr:hypothetical protein B0H19DRAFT_1190765 [Mycena capillaripes]
MEVQAYNTSRLLVSGKFSWSIKSCCRPNKVCSLSCCLLSSRCFDVVRRLASSTTFCRRSWSV